MTTVRPATAEDAGDAFPDLQPDRWREGGNRRSFVATDDSGTVLGHCRGVDNATHPGSRVLLLEVLPDLRGSQVERELLAAQVAASTVPLTMKIHADDLAGRDLAKAFDAVAVQACPPWRRTVGPELRAWAEEHVGPTRRITDDDRRAVLELEVDHYIAQHARWSPAAGRDEMLELLGEDHEPGAPTSYDLEHSVLLERDGRLVAAALLWPPDDEGREVSLLAWPYEGPNSRADKESCLAALVTSMADGDVLLVDSHVTEREEFAMLRELPGPVSGQWLAIVKIPVAGAPRPTPIDADLVPPEASWTLELR